jgi:hypothetical protein
MKVKFVTVRTEGAMLPADLLQRIAAGESGLPGLTPASYHLIEGEKLNKATNRAWNRLQSAWASFRAACDKLSTTDPGVGTTRERWLLPLYQELGYGCLQPLKDAFAIQDRYYPISHAWGYVPIHLVGCRMDLDKRVAGSPSSHSLVQELLNRSEAHLCERWDGQFTQLLVGKEFEGNAAIGNSGKAERGRSTSALASRPASSSQRRAILTQSAQVREPAASCSGVPGHLFGIMALRPSTGPQPAVSHDFTSPPKIT